MHRDHGHRTSVGRIIQTILFQMAVLIAATLYRPEPGWSQLGPNWCYIPVVQGVGQLAIGVSSNGILDYYPSVCYPEFPAYGISYPSGSGVGFGEMNLWVGGVLQGDTLVSSGFSSHDDRYWTEFRFLPCPEGAPIERTSRKKLTRPPCETIWHDDSALSEQDVIVRYTDTVAIDMPANPYDGRTHKPLGLLITQKSYAWSPDYADDFIIFRFEVKNIGVPEHSHQRIQQDTIYNMYIGLEDWVGVQNWLNTQNYSPDLVGFISQASLPMRSEARQTVNAAWSASCDGDPLSGMYGKYSAAGVLAVASLHTPGSAPVSWNWWAPDQNRRLDWGPVRKSSTIDFLHTGLGTPTGDHTMYQLMSNGEVDYPQVETAINHEHTGWLPPPNYPGLAEQIAGGSWVKYLLSTGPFDLPPDSAITWDVVVVGGEHFHTNPDAHDRYFNPQQPGWFMDQLNFQPLLRNLQWARWIYDNPGADTDHDGYAGEYYLRGDDTIYYEGDGVPDIRAGLPPSPPRLRFLTREQSVTIRWNGEQTETEKDIFTLRPDFEGYRVYMSRTGLRGDWALLTQRDLRNYARYTWNDTRMRWEQDDPPFTLDSLEAMYDSLCISRYGYPFALDSFASSDTRRALMEIDFDEKEPGFLDTIYRYFGPYEGNLQADDALLKQAVANRQRVTGVIRKLYPDAPPDSIGYRDDGSGFLPYYEYEYALDSLQIAEPVYFAVTAFDHGDPATRLQPLESAQSVTEQEVWPINSATVVKTEHPKPGVYPNPYRLADDYFGTGWENPRGLEPDRERARKVTFYNVPDTCVVSIWSIDGDLIKRLEHRADPVNSEASVVVWNLITRNTQAVKTGIYIYSVESRFGTDVGKLVIIK